MFLRGAALLLLFLLVQLALCAEDYYKVRYSISYVYAPVRLCSNTLQILGIDKQASDKQIKSAYRQLSKKFHPDKNPYV